MINKSEFWYFLGNQIRECGDVWGEPVLSATITGPKLLDIAPESGSQFLGVRFMHQIGGADEMNSVKFRSKFFNFTVYVEDGVISHSCPIGRFGEPSPECVLWRS